MKLFIPFSLFAVLLACDFSAGPNGSWWVGTEEKGVYAFIEDNGNAQDRIYKGVIYSGSDETVLYEGEFDYSKHTPIDIENRSIYSRWDGQRLYLKDNSFLKPLGKVKKK